MWILLHLLAVWQTQRRLLIADALIDSQEKSLSCGLSFNCGKVCYLQKYTHTLRISSFFVQFTVVPVKISIRRFRLRHFVNKRY